MWKYRRNDLPSFNKSVGLVQLYRKVNSKDKVGNIKFVDTKQTINILLPYYVFLKI